jgi:hypothetical protein
MLIFAMLVAAILEFQSAQKTQTSKKHSLTTLLTNGSVVLQKKNFNTS